MISIFLSILDKIWSQFGHSCMIKNFKYKVLEIVPDITPDKVLLKYLPDTFFD